MEGNPDIYYAAARKCRELADDFDTQFTAAHQVLGTCGSASGLDSSGQDWGRKYDPWVLDTYATVFDSFLLALDKYAEILIQAGHNHAMADYNATSSPGATAPEKPTLDPVDRKHLYYRSLTTLSGTGNGIIDNIGLSKEIGHVVPDGNTEQLEDATVAWRRLRDRTDLGSASKLMGPIVDFEHLDADDAPGIVEDLRDLTQVAADIFTSVTGLHGFAQTQYTNLFDLRGKTLSTTIQQTAAKHLLAVDVIADDTAVQAKFTTAVVSPLAKAAVSAAVVSKVDEWRNDRDAVYSKIVATDLANAKRISDDIKNRMTSDGGSDGATDKNGFPPQAARDKVPKEWGEGKPNKKKVGRRWEDPDNPGNGIRIDQGDPGSAYPTQQVDHVIIRKNGKVIGRDGNPIEGSIQDNAETAHIPLSEWLTWPSWDSP